MSAISDRRNGPFLVAASVGGIVTLALFRLPESFVAQLRRNRALDVGAAGWAFRLLVLAALAQAIYVGFVVLRSERVQKAREQDQKLQKMSKPEIIASTAGNAAGVSLLTLVYGLSAFALTGERGGFWAFVTIFLAQLAWYYRSVGVIAAWMEFQPEFVAEGPALDPASRTDYVPPVEEAPAEGGWSAPLPPSDPPSS